MCLSLLKWGFLSSHEAWNEFSSAFFFFFSLFKRCLVWSCPRSPISSLKCNADAGSMEQCVLTKVHHRGSLVVVGGVCVCGVEGGGGLRVSWVMCDSSFFCFRFFFFFSSSPKYKARVEGKLYLDKRWCFQFPHLHTFELLHVNASRTRDTHHDTTTWDLKTLGRDYNNHHHNNNKNNNSNPIF